MKECIREHEVVEAVVSGRWPDACDAELRRHATDCPVCKDVISVAVALHEERDFALFNARVPSAGLVWWRAELRARREATRTAERPMKVAYSLAAGSVVGVGVALIAGLSPYIRELLAAFIDLPELGLLVGALATLLVIAPLALYFVFSDK
jgi:hypothetical protein